MAVKGVPFKLTKARKARLIEAFEAGATTRWAAAYAGISHRTLIYWFAAAREDPEHPDLGPLLLASEKATAKYAMRLTDIITTQAREDWRAAYGMLKMLHPDQYSERQEITGAAGGALAIEVKLAFDPTPKPGGTDAADDDPA